VTSKEIFSVLFFTRVGEAIAAAISDWFLSTCHGVSRLKLVPEIKGLAGAGLVVVGEIVVDGTAVWLRIV